MNNYNYYNQSPMKGSNQNYGRAYQAEYQQFNPYNRNSNGNDSRRLRNGYRDDERLQLKNFRNTSPQFEAPYKSHYIQRPQYSTNREFYNENTYKQELSKTNNGFSNGNYPYIQSQKELTPKKQTRDSFYDSLQIQKKTEHFDTTLATFDIPEYQAPKKSTENIGSVQGYAASTNRGIVRESNEDRVAIITNIEKINCPPSSFFGIYDGHGGPKCAEFLQENLHQYVIEDPLFPSDPEKALKRGFDRAEKEFTELAIQDKSNIEPSGSCAIVVLIVGNKCYIANVGDSRAILSVKGGKEIYSISEDHKPSSKKENMRILSAGGQIYQWIFQVN